MTVIPVLQGGLANCLFQISNAIAYSLKHNIYYDIPTKIVTPHYKGQEVIYSPKLRYIDGNINELQGTVTTYYEPYFHYKEIPKYDCDYLILNGYFQSAYYSEAYKKRIFSLLGFDNIQTKEGVCSIHFRSCDYNNLPNCHPKITSEYLKAAISSMWFENYKKFKVFSDNIPEVKELISSFTHFKDLEFEYSEGKTEVEDLLDMASCESNIIANSSFSWWAQYINPNADKKVIAPRVWFGKDLNHDIKDLVMPYWTII